MSRPNGPARESLARRVGATMAIVVALGSAFAAVTMGVLANRLLRAREDARLVAAASVFAFELSEADEPLDAIVHDETAEQRAAGIRVAVFRGALPLGGDAALPNVAAGECVDSGEMRACGVGARGGEVAVAAGPRTNDRWPFVVAGALAVLLVSFLGVLSSMRAARWAVEPLVRLERAVARLPVTSGVAPDLGPPDGIAEVDALRDTIATLTARLLAALDESRRFAGDAAHELRSPLTTILGELELVRERAAPDDELNDDLARVHATASRLAVLVERLLVLATPGEELLADGAVGVDALLDDARAAMPSNAAERIVVERAPNDASDVKVRGDRALLVSALVNVLDNAHAYAPAGEIRVRRRVEGVDGVDRVVIQVDDDGPGVAPDVRARVFEPFHRTPEARASAHRGHGIGLALVAHVARAHGGSVAFVDGARGARLELVLPRASTP